MHRSAIYLAISLYGSRCVYNVSLCIAFLSPFTPGHFQRSNSFVSLHDNMDNTSLPINQ